MHIRSGFPIFLHSIWTKKCSSAQQTRRQEVPGVLTEDASDPTLPCSYLYEIRPSEKEEQQMLWTPEGGMIPIVRCEHHRLNLSLGGKLYRNGPQRDIYNSNKIGILRAC